jgi:hypothetical protein
MNSAAGKPVVERKPKHAVLSVQYPLILHKDPRPGSNRSRKWRRRNGRKHGNIAMRYCI